MFSQSTHHHARPLLLSLSCLSLFSIVVDDVGVDLSCLIARIMVLFVQEWVKI